MCQRHQVADHECSIKSKQSTIVEEAANCLTHGMFIPSSLYMLYLFCTLAKTQEDLWNAWIYGVSLIILFSVSTLYHCSCFTPYSCRTLPKSGTHSTNIPP
eukprot:sb/3478513/